MKLNRFIGISVVCCVFFLSSCDVKETIKEGVTAAGELASGTLGPGGTNILSGGSGNPFTKILISKAIEGALRSDSDKKKIPDRLSGRVGRRRDPVLE